MEDMVNEVVEEVSTDVVSEVAQDKDVVGNLVKMGIGGLVTAGAVALAVKVGMPAYKKARSKFKAWRQARKEVRNGTAFDVPTIPEVEEPKK